MSKKLTKIIKNIYEREMLAAVIWGGIGLCNIIFFFTLLPVILILTFGLGLPFLLPTITLGIMGIVMAIHHFRNAKKILNPSPEIIDAYDKSNTNIIVSAIILFIPGLQLYRFLGFICLFCDMYFIRGYVLENKDLFEKEIRTVGVEVETLDVEEISA